MRITFLGAAMVLSALCDPQPSERYLVIPAVHDEVVARPCRAALSSDGSVIAFDSNAALDPTDRNATTDVYVFDRALRRVTLVSRGLSGVAGRGSSRCPSLSADGLRLVFESDAPDLDADDRADTSDVFFFDRATGTLRRLSQWPDTRQASSGCASISADGRVVAFHARDIAEPAATRYRVFLSTLDGSDAPREIAEGYNPAVNRDGRVLAYLVASRAGTAPVLHVREGDALHVAARLEQHAPDAPAETPMLSGDGLWITYASRATNLIAGRQLSGRSHVYLERVADGQRQVVSSMRDGREANGQSTMPAIDGSGERVVFQSTATNLACGRGTRDSCAADINLVNDVFLWERATGAVTRVNAATRELRWMEGGVAPAISGNGRIAAFLSRQPLSDADDAGTFSLFVLPQ
jgi:Tol biopolymer transport system component